MPARLGHWQSRTSSVCNEMTEQWSDRSAMSGHKTLSPPGPMSYLCGLALRIWTSFWRREDSDGMDMWNAPMVQSRQPLTYRLMESVGLGGPKWHESSWQRGIAESGSSRLSTLMIDVPGDLVWDLPCVQQASYLEGGPLMWMLHLYQHVNQKSNYDDDVFCENTEHLQVHNKNGFFQYLLCSKDRNSKSRLTRVMFFCVLHVVWLCLYINFVRNSTIISRTVFKLQSRQEYMVEMATLNVQRAITPNSRQTRVTVHVFCMLSHSVLHLCSVLWKYLGQYQRYGVDMNDGNANGWKETQNFGGYNNTLTTFCSRA